jgi:hypothetical protein
MTTTTGVEVTLSADLIRHLRDEAKQLGVSIQWLIASMIVDTVETAERLSTGPIAA